MGKSFLTRRPTNTTPPTPLRTRSNQEHTRTTSTPTRPVGLLSSVYHKPKQPPKRIQQNVLDISTYGQPLTKGFHAFPKPHELPGEEELRQLGLGYRAKHVAALKKIDLDWLHNLKTLSYKEAKQELQTLSGVGPKVADCVLLFSLDFEQACPEDTWIKKIFAEHDLTREDLGEQAGLIQQSLFHYTRSKKL